MQVEAVVSVSYKNAMIVVSRACMELTPDSLCGRSAQVRRTCGRSQSSIIAQWETTRLQKRIQNMRECYTMTGYGRMLH